MLANRRTGGYLALNPLGGIPTLVVPGHPPLTQSLAILEFLEEFQPTPALLPVGSVRPGARALARRHAGQRHPIP